MNFGVLLASLIIYASFGLTNFIYILITIFSTYFGALYLTKKEKHRKLVLTLILILNMGILVFFKLVTYNHFFNLFNSLIVPLGISYYTFQTTGYLIDVYRYKYEAENKFFNYLLFVMYIPYLFIGPINNYQDIKKTLFKKRKLKAINILNGSERIVLGLFKKLVVAGRLNILITSIGGNNYQGAYVLFIVILYSFMLYSDFSGGIDIVIGISKMLGIELKENFDSPFLALNLRDFWHRWHISLSSWFKEYLYIPLGGNRVSKVRNKLNIIITFMISGLWHGINYFYWGLFHGLIVALTGKEKNNYKILRRILTFLVVSLLWVFFVYPTSGEALRKLLSIFTTFNYLDLFHNLAYLGLDLANMIVLIIGIIMILIYDYYKDKILIKFKKMSLNTKLIVLGVGILGVLTLGIYGIGFNVSEFIYSKF